MSPLPDEYDQTLVSVSLSPGLLLRSRYRLVRELGRGGMGIVWLAVDTELSDRPVAVKLLPTVLSRDKRAVARLKKEALSSIELSHPHIVRLINFEVDPALNDLAFLVMQYIDGQTLNDLLADHPEGIPLERVQRWGMQIAGAIDHAHERGVLHRDIKPSNIIIDGDDNAYLMDFGIAREARDTMTRVTGRESSGTLPYMSPQHVDGENHPSNDIYSFAATLYEALSGDPPFSTGDIYRQIKHVEARPINGLPEHVNQALLAGLAKDMGKRPLSATAQCKLFEAPRVATPPPPTSSPSTADHEIERLLSEESARTDHPQPAETKPSVAPAQREGVGSWLGKLVLVFVILGAVAGVGYIALDQSGAFQSPAQNAAPQTRSPVTSSSTSATRAPSRPGAASSPSPGTPSAASTSTPSSTPAQASTATPSRTNTISTPPPVSEERKAGERRVITLPGTNVQMAFRWCPPGEFVMGSPPNEAGRFENEGPQRTVRFRAGFWLGETPVTQAQWRAVMGTNPSYFKGDDRPVESVSWNDAQEFIKKLRERGLQARLPSEAEWEYACRAGSTTRYSFGDDESRLGEYAWYSANSRGSTQPVGRKKPNNWGLFDMHGNVWEWCADVWHDNYSGAPTDGSAWVAGGDQSRRVLRGGGWYNSPQFCRSATRDWGTPDYRLRVDSFGFRLALDSF